MKYVYGPIQSRRLGSSLGITLTPYKVCSFNCVYCQLGRTGELTLKRKEYLSVLGIIEELNTWIKDNPLEAKKLNYITFSGSGEPSLHIGIGELIRKIKKIIPVPVAVITNASLVNIPLVRRQLQGADLIVPSLNAATQEIFEKIDRPAKGIRVRDIIDGLVKLRKEFKGKIWLEIMLVKGVNDDLTHVRKLKEAIDKINPDSVQLNSPVRATAESGVCVVDKSKLLKIKEILGDKCETV